MSNKMKYKTPPNPRSVNVKLCLLSKINKQLFPYCALKNVSKNNHNDFEST